MIVVIITTIICTLILSVCIGISIYALATIPTQKPVYGYEWRKLAHDFGMEELHLLKLSITPEEFERAFLNKPDEWRHPTKEELESLKCHHEGNGEILSMSFAPMNATGEPDYEKAIKFTPDQLNNDKPYEQTATIKW